MKRVFIILVAVVLCVTLTIPAIAATITGYTDINIADYVSDREYVGDEVIVTYDMPLRPYSEYYGTAADGTQGVFATSTDIYFSQESDSQTSEVFTTVYDFGTVTVPSNSNTNNVHNMYSYSLESGVSSPMVDWSKIDCVKLNGVLLPRISVDNNIYNYGDFIVSYTLLSGYYFTILYFRQISSYQLSVGYMDTFAESVYEYSKFGASLWPLGFTDGSVGVVDISDIREGANFDLTFSYNCQILTDGSLSNPQPVFYSFYLDENGNQIYMREEHFDVSIDSDQDTSFEHTATFTVPEGAAYFYLRFDTSMMDVKSCRKIDWDFDNLIMTCALSALELESETLEEVTARLDAIDQKLDDAINGPHGFDSSGSDFSGAADNLAGASGQMHDAMSGGMGSIGNMVNSPVFATTLTTLAACFDAVFVGHEVEICGVDANPFALLASILAVVILIPLALKFVFRKWGSGGSSGGESDA